MGNEREAYPDATRHDAREQLKLQPQPERHVPSVLQHAEGERHEQRHEYVARATVDRPEALPERTVP